jgi:hypothetical protein
VSQGESELQKLPSEADFVVYGNLDESYAWKNFGGLTLEEAKAKFAEHPLHYQEDFMYMGTNAFAFYFPVVDWWLRSVPETDEPEHDSEAWILAKGVQDQFDDRTFNRLRTIAPDVLALSEYVRDRIERFGWDDEQRRRVADAWTELSLHILTIADA